MKYLLTPVLIGFLSLFNSNYVEAHSTFIYLNESPENVDSLKIAEYYQTGFGYYRGGMLDSAFIYLNKSDSLALKTGNDFRHYKAQFGIASCWISKGDFQSALDIYNVALANLDDTFPKSQEIVALAYQGIGLVNYYKQNFDKSIYNYGITKKIKETYFGKSHIETGKIYANIGLTFELLSMYDSSIYYQKKALKIFQDSLGNEHSYVGRMYYNMAISYNEIGESTISVNLMQSAISIREKTYGKEHFQVARAYELLGVIYIAQSEYALANTAYETAIAIRESLNITEESRDLGTSYERLAVNYANNGNPDLAFAYIKKAQEILAKSMGKNSPEYLICEATTAEIYFKMGNYEMAINQYDKYINIYLENELDYKYSLAEGYYYKGVSLSKLGKFEKSVEVQNNCLQTLVIPNGLADGIPEYTSPILALQANLSMVESSIEMGQKLLALENISQSELLLEKTRGLFVINEDVKDVNQIWNDLNQFGVQVSYALYQKTQEKEYLGMMFEFINKNKGSLINAKLNDALAQKAHNLPDSIQLKEQNLISLLSSPNKWFYF